MNTARYSSVLVFALAVPAAGADNFYPMLMSVGPIAVQAGHVTECVLESRYSLGGAYQIFVTGEGVTGEVDGPAAKPSDKPAAADKAKVRFKVASNALLGVRDVRIATPRGVSTVGQIVVARDPVVREAANNDTLTTAETISLPATVCGAIEKEEDVDYYKFTVAPGASQTLHVRCQRLQNRIHDLQKHADPIVTVRNAAGTVLAANDNYFFGDPLLHYHFKQGGEYFLEIRDVRYAGSPSWQYCIEINDRPFVTNVYPSRVTPGVATNLELVGYNLPNPANLSLTLPADAQDGLHWVVATANNKPTNPLPIVVSRLPEAKESDVDKATAAKAQKVPVPGGVSGRLAKPEEVDCYAFEAKKGERFTVRVVARDHQSALDSTIRILNAKGERQTENDDSNDRMTHADSLIENWSAPADGPYVVEIRDVHLRGGPAFVYFLELTRAEPYFKLDLDTDKTILPPGGAGVVFVRVNRENGFKGEIQLGIEGLPKGVSAKCGRILESGRDGCIMLQAGADARLNATNIRVTGAANWKNSAGKEQTMRAEARPMQEIYMPGGGRSHYPVELHTVCVSVPLDLKSVRISPTEIVLKPGESKKIDVSIERSEGFKQNVILEGFYQHLGSVYGNSLPAGVSVDDKASQTLLTGDQSKGSITLKAAADAKPVEKQQVAIMAQVSINFVMKFTYCGEPLLVTVRK